MSGSTSGEIYKQYIFAQAGSEEGVCSWAAKGGWADTVSNRISQIIKITLPLISSDPDSSLFINTVPWWGFNKAGRCQMVEADRRQEEGICTKYQGCFIWKRITPLKGELPFWQCWNPAEFTQFHTGPAQDFDGDFKALCSLNPCISYPWINILPLPETDWLNNAAVHRDTPAALLNLMTWHLFLFLDFISSISLSKYTLFFHGLKIKANSHQQSFVQMRQHTRRWFVWPA